MEVTIVTVLDGNGEVSVFAMPGFLSKTEKLAIAKPLLEVATCDVNFAEDNDYSVHFCETLVSATPLPKASDNNGAVNGFEPDTLTDN